MRLFRYIGFDREQKRHSTSWFNFNMFTVETLLNAMDKNNLKYVDWYLEYKELI